MLTSKKGIGFLFCLFSLLVFAGPACAGQVSQATAWQVAQNLMTNHVAVHNDWNGNQSPHPQSIEVVNYKGEPVAYLVTAHPSGHVLVAYYDDFSPVLFYSPSSTLDPSKANDPNDIESWIIPEIYNIIQHLNGKVPVADKETNQTIILDALITHSTKAGARSAAAWKMLNVPSESFTAVGKSSVRNKAQVAEQATFASSVGPLLTTTWAQGDPNDFYSPYNEYAPGARGCTHTLTGCVATAMAQVMKYWNWPDTGLGSYSYTLRGISSDSFSLNGTTLSANFNHAYNWSSMPNELTSYSTATQDDAVARLMSDLGISVSMEYGCSNSGADPNVIPGSLSAFFKYQSTANIVARADYPQSNDWMALIETELNATTPRVMLFSIATTGYDPTSHMVVIDGYQTSVSGTDQVHINYGWGGFTDGYYDITSNWTTDAGNTWDVNDQGLVIGIEPLPGSINSFSLSILQSGSGTGMVTSSPPGISCGSTCSVNYIAGTTVTLTATPSSDSTFTGWSGGGCSGTGACSITINAAESVTANFMREEGLLTILKSGILGTVTSIPPGISCGSTCSASFDTGTTVTLTAMPSAVSIFSGWSGGGCSGTDTCSITMNTAESVTATFTLALNEFPLPTGYNELQGITAGPHGNLWFTDYDGNKIGRITTAGVITEFPIPTSDSYSSGPYGIAAGPDDNLWFTEWGGNKIGRITTAGVITQIPIPTGYSAPNGIAAGPDGNLWFTEYDGNKIGRITTAGVITEFPIPASTIDGVYGLSSSPKSIAAGPDGNLWFTEYDGNKIGRITTAGVITEFPIPTSDSYGSDPNGIAAGPDDNLWFTEWSGNKIGRISTAGVFTEFPIPTGYSEPQGITAGPDGNLWFTENDDNKIGQITTAGVITEFPTGYSSPNGIAAGPDGNLWFTDYHNNNIGKLVLATSGQFMLTIIDAGTGNYGIVTPSTGTITWNGSTDMASYSSGTNVTLTATANFGSTFTGWSGACQTESATCVVTMTADEAVTAHYIITGTPSFSDVPSTSTYESYIEAIYNNGITTGCGSGDYCPSEDVTRDQMAAFLVRATQVAAGQNTTSFTCNGGVAGSSVSCATTTPYFSDVSAIDSFFPYVQKLYELGITTGWGGGDYCPSENVTRDQMAAFIIRALYGGSSYTPICNGGVAGASLVCSSTTPYFSDVPATDQFFPYVQKMKELGITTGCGGGQYCPFDDVTRDQMAAFLARTFLGMQ